MRSVPSAFQRFRVRQQADQRLREAAIHVDDLPRDVGRVLRPRPANANGRLKRDVAGDVVLQLKSAWRDGTTHIRMSTLEFMQRLAALVPYPRLHLTRFHGVLAPNVGLRAAVVPGSPLNTSKPGVPADEHAHGAPARMGWARLLKRVVDLVLEHRPQCGGEFRIIAAIEAPEVIARILTHLGLPARAPPRSPALPLPLFQVA